MSRFLWLSDIHLEWLEADAVVGFLRTLSDHRADGVLISGDIAVATLVTRYLRAMEAALEVPIYFVLGNHDFYGGSIRAVREQAARLTRDSRFVAWLPEKEIVSLSPEVALAGHDGWADGRLGTYETSEIMMNDYVLIDEFKPRDKESRLSLLNELGDEAASYLRRVLPRAMETHRTLIVLTHFPPFKEACFYDGRTSADDWLPHLACRAVGDELKALAGEAPDREILVLCGHTHGRHETKILPNLKVRTAGAEYGKPDVQDILEF
jgi:Icc-related predicted phosphoesterase